MFPKVVQVVPTEEYTMYVYFEDGKTMRYDVKSLLEKEVFSVLREAECFIQTCTITNDTLAWNISGIGIVRNVLILIRIRCISWTR